MVKLLVQSGANPFVKSNVQSPFWSGYTHLSYARTHPIATAFAGAVTRA